MIETKLSFQNRNDKEFAEVLKKRVKNYFADNNISQHANAEMIIKTIILLGSYAGIYCLIVFGSLPVWANWLLCLPMGILTAGIGMSVAHDGIHGAYSKSDRVNYWIGLTMNLIGGNRYVWSITHNIIHHTYTNIHEHDEDLELAPFLRLSRHAPRYKVHRGQQFFAFPTYGLSSIFWVLLKDFKKISQRNIGPYQNKKHPRQEIFMLILTKCLYYIYTIALPLIFMDVAWWQFIIGYLTMHVTAGIILGVVFQLAHVVENTEHPDVNDDLKMTDSWIVNQLKTTNNFGMTNRILNWYVGGLNFQVEHHLFPQVCSVHYTKISKIVQATTAEYGLPYHYHKSFRAAVASHYRTLKHLGRYDDMKPIKGEHETVLASSLN